VRGWTKAILLGMVIVAILYVLISPLPELDATSTLNFPILPLMLLSILMPGFCLPTAVLAWCGRVASVSERDILQGKTCVMLC
jgi:hypothetical protein